MKNLKKLWDIQQLEQKSQQLQRQLEDDTVVNELLQQKQSIENDKQQFKDIEKKYTLLKRKIKEIEDITESIDNEINTLNDKLYNNSKNGNKEIMALQNKITTLKQDALKHEDDELQLMEEQEQFKKQLQAMSADLKERINNFFNRREEYYSLKNNIKSEQQQLQDAIENNINDLEQDIIHKYEQLKKKYKDPVAKVEKGICSGCRMELTLVSKKKLKNEQKLVKCENCGRLIFGVSEVEQ